MSLVQFANNYYSDGAPSHDPIIRDLQIMSRANNYRGWILDKLRPHIGSHVIEIGAGIGTYTEDLLYCKQVIAVDTYKPCVRYLQERFAESAQVTAIECNVSSERFRFLRSYGSNTALCVNVLEHVQCDLTALRNIKDVLVKGGKLLLLVPAGQGLYGSIDKLVGHYRRYSKKALSSLIQIAGYTIVDISFMNSLAVPAWFFNNRIRRLKEESPSQVAFYDRYIVPWLKKTENIIPPPVGLSLVVVAKK